MGRRLPQIMDSVMVPAERGLVFMGASIGSGEAMSSPDFRQGVVVGAVARTMDAPLDEVDDAGGFLNRAVPAAVAAIFLGVGVGEERVLQRGVSNDPLAQDTHVTRKDGVGEDKGEVVAHARIIATSSQCQAPLSSFPSKQMWINSSSGMSEPSRFLICHSRHHSRRGASVCFSRLTRAASWVASRHQKSMPRTLIHQRYFFMRSAPAGGSRPLQARDRRGSPDAPEASLVPQQPASRSP